MANPGTAKAQDAHQSAPFVTSKIQDSISVMQQLLSDGTYVSKVDEVGQLIAASLRAGGRLFLCGNGGSAADAQHLAAEFTGRFLKERASLAAIALTTNSSVLTCIANDYSYEEVFSRQIEGLARTGDVLIGISTSGNSENVLRALHAARKIGVLTVAMTGTGGGKLGDAAQHCIKIPSAETPRIQESHILTGHILAEMVENELFGA